MTETGCEKRRRERERERENWWREGRVDAKDTAKLNHVIKLWIFTHSAARTWQEKRGDITPRVVGTRRWADSVWCHCLTDSQPWPAAHTMPLWSLSWYTRTALVSSKREMGGCRPWREMSGCSWVIVLEEREGDPCVCMRERESYATFSQNVGQTVSCM